MKFKLALGAVLLLAALVFVLQNSGVVEVKFLVWNFSTSLALLIFVSLASGLFAGWVLTSAAGYRKKSGSQQ